MYAFSLFVCMYSTAGAFWWFSDIFVVRMYVCFCRQALWEYACVCVSARSSCHVALCVGVSVHSRPLTHMPPLRGPRWLRWVSTHGVHGLDHSVCCGDIGRLLLQAVGLFVDRLYLDVWFTEGDTPSTWKKSTTSGHNLSQRQESYWFIYFFKQSKKAKQNNSILFWFILCLSDLSGPLSALFIFSPLILVH